MREQEYVLRLRVWKIFALLVIAISLLGWPLAGNIHAQALWPDIAAEIDHSFSAPQDSKPVGLAWDGEYFWISDDDNDTIYKIDTDDGTVILSFPSPGPRPFGLAWDGQYLWHADAELDTIYKLDPSDGSVISGIPTPGQRDEVSYPIASLAWDGQNLWTPFYSRNGSFLYKIDPSDGSIIDSVSLSQTPSGLSGTFFCVPEDLAWDEGFLFINASAECRMEGQESLPWDDYILRYDPASRTFQVCVRIPPILSGRFYLPSNPSGLTLDGDHKIWFTDKWYDLVCSIMTFEITQDHLTTDDHESGAGWLRFYPTFTLSALSDQVAHIYYRINDGEVQEGTVVSLDANGKFAIFYWGVDTEGRVEYPYNVFNTTIDVPPVDTTPPQVSYPETIKVRADEYARLDYQGEPVQVVYIIFKNYISITDDMDDNVKLTITPPDPYPVGTTIVHFTATDDGGNSTSGSITIIVEENPDLHYFPGYYGSSSDFGISTIFYGPWGPAVSSYPGYIRTQGYGAYGGYPYGQWSSGISSYPEYRTAGFSSYGGYYNGSGMEALDPPVGSIAYWAYLPSGQNFTSNRQSQSLLDPVNPLFFPNLSYSYPGPFIGDSLSYPVKTDTFISHDRLLLNSLNPFYDIPSYQFLRRPFPLYEFLQNFPAILLF